MLLTITGDADRFNDPSSGVIKLVNDLVEKYTIQRFELEQDQGILRIIVAKSEPEKTLELVGALRNQLSNCHISYINMDTAV